MERRVLYESDFGAISSSLFSSRRETITEVVSYSVSRLLLLRSVYSIYVSSEKTTTIFAITLSREEVERTEKERVYTTYILQRKRKREEDFSIREEDEEAYSLYFFSR